MVTVALATAALHVMDSTMRARPCFLPNAATGLALDDYSRKSNSSDEDFLFIDDGSAAMRSDESSASDHSCTDDAAAAPASSAPANIASPTTATTPDSPTTGNDTSLPSKDVCKETDPVLEYSDETTCSTAPEATVTTTDSSVGDNSMIKTGVNFDEVDASLPPPPVAFIETSAKPPQIPLIKPALKRVSSYGILMEEEEIPISTKKSDWKSLPVPTVTNMRRISSTGSFFPASHHARTNSVGSAETDDAAGAHEAADGDAMSPTTRRTVMKRNVSFAKIHVRDYEMTIGDNPACTYGTPVSLDWSYVQHDPLELDQYEDNRPKRRNPRQMHLNSVQRQHMLRLSNISDADIAKAKRDAERIQRQRAITAYFSRCMKIEDAMESAARKTKRFLKHRTISSSTLSSPTSQTKEQVSASLPPRSPLGRGRGAVSMSDVTASMNPHRHTANYSSSTRSLGCLDEEDTVESGSGGGNASIAHSIITI